MSAPEDLPRLPLPALDETCARFIDIITPLAGPEQLEHARALVEDFREGRGPWLQSLLKRWDDASPTSYVHELWLSKYLQDRAPLPLQSGSVYLALPPPVGQAPPARRVGVLLAAAARVRQRIRRSELTPDVAANNTLCMSQYPFLFGTNRHPGLLCDEVHVVDDDGHVVVIYRGGLYAVQIIDGEAALSARAIERQIEAILSNPSASTAGVGALTALGRCEWAIHRRALARHCPANLESLHAVDSAMMVVCLEEAPYTSVEDAAWSVQVGDVRNRWFDKSVQILLTPDGGLGVQMEHSMLDGTTVGRFFQEVFLEAAVLWGESDQAGERPREPRPLAWRLPDGMAEHIEEAALGMRRDRARHGMRYFEYDWNRKAIIASGFSPDAFIQLALQLAFRRLHGYRASVYESVQTRRYHHGRTEAMRSATREAGALMEGVLLGKEKAELFRLLSEAERAHVERVRECQQGHGVDRHLFALHALCRGTGDEHPLFRDPAYAEILGKAPLSTSGVTAMPGIDVQALGFFAPPEAPAGAPNAYSAVYIVGAERVRFSITSRACEPDPFVAALRRSLDEYREILTSGNREPT